MSRNANESNAACRTRHRRAIDYSMLVLRAFFQRYQLWRLRHIKLVLHNLLAQTKNCIEDDPAHLSAALDWLCLAQDVCKGQSDQGAVSAGWSLEDGWLPGYPETTGYIIETFIDAADALRRSDLLDRAYRMIDWELSLQHADGAFPGHYGEPASKPVIFNTGQIIHGLLAGHQRFGREDCLDASVRAGFWLVDQQDADGCWRRSQHNGIPHTYDTRASWALLRVGVLANESALQLAARRQLDWGLRQQDEDGWFANNAFTTDAAPFTHTIGYAVSGFLGSGMLLGEERYIGAARKAARALANVQRSDGWIAGIYGPNWTPRASFCCLTGLAQMAVNWSLLADYCGDAALKPHAQRALGYLKKHHQFAARDDSIRGGLAGSYPIWGAYERFCYPAWAAKFFADALIAAGQVSRSRTEAAVGQASLILA